MLKECTLLRYINSPVCYQNYEELPILYTSCEWIHQGYVYHPLESRTPYPNKDELLRHSQTRTWGGIVSTAAEQSTPAHRVHIAKLRTSSHDLRIEKGRYTTNQFNKHMKTCRFCCTTDIDVISNFEALPYFEDPIYETESHVLTECPGYHHLRSRLSDNLKSLLILQEYAAIMTSGHLPEFGKFLVDCYYIHNPRQNTTRK